MDARPSRPPQIDPVSTLAQALTDADWTRTPSGLNEIEWPSALSALASHGLASAIAQRMRATTAWPSMAPEVRAALEKASHALVVREMAHRVALERIGAALHERGLSALVIKGEALARSHFDRPALRERGDIDLWVAADEFDAAAAVLEGLGWRARVAADGHWSLPERSFDGPHGVVIDLHRRLFSQPLLARALSFEDTWRASIAFDALRAPCPAHALLIAVLHRIAHHADQLDRWVWLWDVHVLVEHDPSTLALAAEQARAAGVAALLGTTLRDTQRIFATDVPDDVIEELSAHVTRERSARLLRPMGGMHRLLFDVLSTPNWRVALTLLAETLFPRREYMQTRFGPGWLPALHAKRWWRRLRRTWANT
jgi:hypothetical protein